MVEGYHHCIHPDTNLTPVASVTRLLSGAGYIRLGLLEKADNLVNLSRLWSTSDNFKQPWTTKDELSNFRQPRRLETTLAI